MAVAGSVLVTGGQGFIGRHTLAPLVERGYRVHLLSRSPASSELVSFGSNVTHHRVDLHDTDNSLPLIKALKATHLLHLAWETRHGQFWSAPDNLDWIVTSKLVLLAFIEGGGSRAVAVGTSAEYDWSQAQDRLIEGVSKLAPLSMFGQTKLAFRKTMLSIAERHSVSVAWARPFMVFGEGEDARRFVSAAAIKLLRGEPVEASIGDQVRDLMHVSDLARGLVALLDSPVTGDVNIASGKPRTVAEVLKLLSELIGAPHLLRLGSKPKQPHEPARIVAATERLNKEVGFKPKASLRDRFKQTLDWWRLAL
ncbi:MAG: NAD-dependent epimerase/dehydratase family protein [Pseudomonadota bacterium]|jgi:nucleoside-diphosphate-sugar epimerase